MKKISKILSAVALSAAFCMGAAGAAFADVAYQNRDVVITGAGQYTATDLFENFKNVMPGDELDQPVTIENNASLDVKVYLRAEAHGAGNDLTYSEGYEEIDGKDQGAELDGIGGEGQRDETVTTMIDFLTQLSMTIKNGEKVVFQASPDQEAQLSDNVPLGELAPGESMQIDVDLLVPIELGNEYAYRVGEVDWVFTVEEIVPDTGLSQTGDEMPVLMLAGLAVAAVAVALVAVFAMKRRSRQ